MDGIVYSRGGFRPAAEAVVSVFDHGLLYGDGVFEGIRAYNGRVFKLERHVERLFESARAIRLAIPASPEAVVDIVLETCRRNAVRDGYIRLVVTRGAGDLGIDPSSCPHGELLAIARPVGALYGRAHGAGIALATSALRRVSADALSPSIKSLNYLNNVLARLEASDRGADEALFLDKDGYVAEATADNIFIAAAGTLVTPPTSQALKGITRDTVIELAAGLGIPVVERPCTLFDVWTAAEVFICGTMAEVVPVATVDGRRIGDGRIGPITARIVEAYGAFVRSTGAPIGSERSEVA